MSTRYKILLIIPSLEGGGAEKLFVSLLEKINLDQFDLWVCFFQKKEDYPYAFDKKINIIYIIKRFKIDLLLFLKLFILIRKNQFHCVHTWLLYTNLIGIFLKILNNSTLGTRFKLILSTHNDYSQKFKFMHIKGTIYSCLVKFFFNFADSITTVSQSSAQELYLNFSIKREKIITIYNGIDIKKIQELCSEDIFEIEFFSHSFYYIIAIGALDIEQKDYITLIQAFKLASIRARNLKLIILGKGRDELKLINLVKDLSLNNSVIFMGFQQNPYKFLHKANLFVQISKYEGLPELY